MITTHKNAYRRESLCYYPTGKISWYKIVNMKAHSVKHPDWLSCNEMDYYYCNFQQNQPANLYLLRLLCLAIKFSLAILTPSSWLSWLIPTWKHFMCAYTKHYHQRQIQFRHLPSNTINSIKYAFSFTVLCVDVVLLLLLSDLKTSRIKLENMSLHLVVYWPFG